MNDQLAADPAPLAWNELDPECRLGIRGARFTGVHGLLALAIGLLLTGGFFAALIPFAHVYAAATFLDRGIIPYFVVGFFFWSLAILIVKSLKLRVQRAALQRQVLPDDPLFVLSPSTVDQVIDRIYLTVDDPIQFILFNRMVIALSNVRNLGRFTDVDTILRSQAEQDQAGIDTSYHLLNGFIWAIPVLGFIGTVLGLSQAIGGFGSVLTTSTDMAQIKDSLKLVVAGLAIAFETTLHGLVAALVLQLLLTGLKKSEEEFLDACSEYCLRHIVGRMRLAAGPGGETAP